MVGNLTKNILVHFVDYLSTAKPHLLSHHPPKLNQL